MSARFMTKSALAAIAVLMFWSASTRADLITNGDFEVFSTGFYANPGSPITDGGWTFANHAGVELGVGNPSKAARLESNGSSTWDPTISRTVTGLTAGETYTLFWDLALRVNYAGSGTGRSFGVFLDSQTFNDALFFHERLSTSYETQSVDFVATATAHTVIFAGELDNRTNGGVGNTDVSYRIDNIRLVPEPSSWTLFLACAVFGTAVLYRRRQSVPPACVAEGREQQPGSSGGGTGAIALTAIPGHAARQ